MKKLVKFFEKGEKEIPYFGILDTETDTILCLCCGSTLEMKDIELPFRDYGNPFPCLNNAIRYWMDDESE